MKYLFTISLFIATSLYAQTPLSKFCLSFRDQTDRLSCITQLENSYFDSEALSYCQQDRYAESRLNCANIIKNRVYTDSFAVCSSFHYREDVYDCLRKTGRPTQLSHNRNTFIIIFNIFKYLINGDSDRARKQLVLLQNIVYEQN